MGKLDGRIAIVTGAASGMGRAHAIGLAREGALVAATDRNLDGVQKTVALISAASGHAIALEHDVANESAWRMIISETKSQFGDATILVNNAGVYVLRPAEEMSLSEWDFVLSVNARGTFIGCREVIPGMKRAGGGSIINVSSTFGLVGRAGFSAYCASKGAIRLFTKAVAAELAPYGIRANTVHPGTIETAMTAPLLTTQEGVEALMGSQPVRRIGRPEEVASAVVFLASDDSSYMTGSELVVDGGYVAI